MTQKNECCGKCKENPMLPVYQFSKAVCMNPTCPCYTQSKSVEVEGDWKDRLEAVLPLIVEDYNNFIIEAGEIGELDMEEIVSERIKPFIAIELAKARESGYAAAVEEVKNVLPNKQPGEFTTEYFNEISWFGRGFNRCLQEVDAGIASLSAKQPK